MRRHDLLSDEDADEMVNAAAMDLFSEINKRYVGARFNASNVNELEQLCYDFMLIQRRRGIDFPQIVAVLLLKQGAVELVRRDLDQAGRERLVRRIAAKYPGIEAGEIAWGFMRAFPGSGGHA